ncbi:MAG TPA: NAD(P)H-binding protein [Waddliaceae bacterium]
MAKRNYTVIGATGQIGHVVVERLLIEGHYVKAVGRDRQKLDYLKSKGAEVISVENFEHEAKISQACQGIDALFCMLPPGSGIDNYPKFQDAVGEVLKTAIHKNSIQHVVNLSSIGAHLPEGTGPIKGLYRQEQRLNTLSDVNILHLRPGYFMENLFWSIPMIHQTGTLKTLFKPDISISMVSTEDIGMKAAECLNNLNFEGHTIFDFVGPRSLNVIEVAKILGGAIGKPDLKCAQQAYEEAKKEMLSAGMPPTLADLIIEMYQAFNAGKCLPTQKLTPEHQGKITIEQFARQFAQAYKQVERQKATI